jgi:hypothetical protein
MSLSASSSKVTLDSPPPDEIPVQERYEEDIEQDDDRDDAEEDVPEGMHPDGFSGPKDMVVKPLTPEALAAFNAAQERAGVIYISRIPPGMQPTKVRHLMSAYGDVGRVYLQPEGRRFCSTLAIFFFLLTSSDRSKKSISPQKVHCYEKGSFYRRLGRVQGQETCPSCS